MMLSCRHCNNVLPSGSKFCNHCGTKVPVAQNRPLQAPYDSAYGTWHVTTEGDCEGRSVRNLGVHEGFIDDIAAYLAPSCEYTLQFKGTSTKRIDVPENKPKSVSVSFYIDSGTWDMSPKDRRDAFALVLKDRPVVVKTGTYYASVELTFPKK
jgi:hypothetical protein